MAVSINPTFPSNAKIGTLMTKNQILYGYLNVNNITTWYPLTMPQKVYTHKQTSSSNVWTINHNFNTDELWLMVTNSLNQVVLYTKTIINNNSFTLTFNDSIIGTCIVIASKDITNQNIKCNTLTIGTKTNISDNGIYFNNSKIRILGLFRHFRIKKGIDYKPIPS